MGDKSNEEYLPGLCSSDDPQSAGDSQAGDFESVGVEAAAAAADQEPFQEDKVVPGRLVVKHTFLTFLEDEESPSSAGFLVPRSKTEPRMRAPEEDEQEAETATEESATSSERTSAASSESSPLSSPCGTLKADSVAASQSSSSLPNEAETRTTVMLKHLPNNYTRAMFLAMLDQAGFANTYDFVYLPIDFNRKAGFGYAFVNLIDPALVPEFWRTFDGFTNWVLPTTKVCEVSWSSPIQGLAANVERYRNSSVMHRSVPDEYKPLVLRNGVSVDFPKPTKSLRPPYGRK